MHGPAKTSKEEEGTLFMNLPISDDMEKNYSAQSINDDTIEVEAAILEHSDDNNTIEVKAAILEHSDEKKHLPSRPSIPSPIFSEDGFVQEGYLNTSAEHNDNEQGHQNDDPEKTVSLTKFVPFTPEVVHLPTQPLISNGLDKLVRKRRSRALQRDYTNVSNRPTRSLVPMVSGVRTTATLQMFRAQQHRKLQKRHLSRKRMRQSRVEVQRLSSRFWTTTITIIMLILISILSVAGGGAYTAYSFYAETQDQYAPQVHDLRDLMPGDNLKMYDRNGTLIGQDLAEGMKTTVPISQVSSLLISATVDTEDKGFWTNPGVDVTRIIQAAVDDLRSNRIVAGGSTITQQLIKNLILTRDQNIQRKLQEVALVPDVNNHYSKSDILEMYLNSCNYGEMAYGPEAAATVYFGLEAQGDKSAASQLDLAQAATLAGIPNSPSAYDPFLHPETAYARLQVVLNAMLNSRDITRVQELDALNEAQQPDFFKTSPKLMNRAPHFYFFILDQLKQQYHMTDQQIAMSDMKVYTTLDINLQDKIQKIAQDQIAGLAQLHVTNAAEVLIDFHTGAILSMLGSIDYHNTAIDGQYNAALAYRQPGSSFKPYVYVSAFGTGISPGQGIADEPLTIRVSDTETFSPQDADGKFHGQMTIRCALQNSFNIPAVRTLQYVGIDKAMEMAKNMGIASYTGTPGLSLVLGGLGVRLLDHTSAYGTFANGGVHVPYYGIEKIAFANTNRVDQHKADPGTRVFSPQLAYMMTDVLTDNSARSHEFGKCSMLYLFSNSQNDCYAGNPGSIRPSAAKTGTTNDFRDNLTMGYTTDYVMGVWAGNNDNSPMNTVLGVTGAAPIWHYGMLAAEEGHPISAFTNPGGLQKVTVTYPDRVRSTDLFLQGQDPRLAATNPANFRYFAPGGSGGGGTPWCSDFSY